MILLHITNILVIMGLIFYLRFLVSDKSYSLILSIFYFVCSKGKNARGISWYKNNPIYIYHMLLILILLLINITLIGQLMRSDILNRPIFNLILSPLAWGLVLITKHIAHTPKKDIA